MKKLLGLVFVFILVLFSSCDLLGELFSDENNNLGNASSGKFWARNTSNNEDYRVSADLLVRGRYCNIWVEKGSATKSQAQMVANEYDNKIYGMMIENFSVRNFTDGNKKYDNIMEYADWLGDGDGKLFILLLDIKDNYRRGINNSYVAGYFLGIHFFNTSRSNGRDMIFVDTNPGMGETEEAFSTLAHEMQHLMNLATTFYLRSERNKRGELLGLSPMDTWVDEGLASAAEYLYKGHLDNRIDWYVYNGYKEEPSKAEYRGLIDKGNNFFVWENHNNNQYAVMDDYATVYLFFQWLRLQAGRSSIYNEIIASKDSDYNAVTKVMNAAVSGQGFSNWDVLLKSWLAANYINAPTGIYGYKNDSKLKVVKVPAPFSGNIDNLIRLDPGEGVYSRMSNGSNMPAASGQIRYSSLSKSPVAVDNTTADGRILLSYNVNTNNEDNSEFGATTGIAIPSASVVNITFPERSAISKISRPYKIDAADIVGRDKFNVVKQIVNRKVSDVKE